jgi:hypothetical protein
VARAIREKKAHLNCIHHLLQQMPYVEVDRPGLAYQICNVPRRAHRFLLVLHCYEFNIVNNTL